MTMAVLGKGTTIVVDNSHCGGRQITGLERITLELFSAKALSPLKIRLVEAGSKIQMIIRQQFYLPLIAMGNPRSLIITPGFPPALLLSLFGKRVIPYIHDVFLITRKQDLNLTAKLYMRGPFKFALRTLPRFLVNSRTTAAQLRLFCKKDAEIILYRPEVKNVFGLEAEARRMQAQPERTLRLVTIGTLEPRKNIKAAVAILAALRKAKFPSARLDIIGRSGWGVDIDALKQTEGVILHGYQSPEKIRQIVDSADIFLSTSHDEGLGLPLLEVQYSGILVVAPDLPVFREVLGDSGVFIDPTEPELVAGVITSIVESPSWRDDYACRSLENIKSWNANAEADRRAVIAKLNALSYS